MTVYRRIVDLPSAVPAYILAATVGLILGLAVVDLTLAALLMAKTLQAMP